MVFCFSEVFSAIIKRGWGVGSNHMSPFKSIDDKKKGVPITGTTTGSTTVSSCIYKEGITNRAY